MSLVLQSEEDEEDGVLLEEDSLSVHRCGIRQASTVRLHSLCHAAPGRTTATGTRCTARSTTSSPPRREAGSHPLTSPPVSPVEAAAAATAAPASSGARGSSPMWDHEAAAGKEEEEEEKLARAEKRARRETREWTALVQRRASPPARRHPSTPNSRRRPVRGTTDGSQAPAPVHEHTVLRRGVLDTPIQPHEADHSYNGVVFDVKSHGDHEVTITSLWVGGMLSLVRVYAADDTWHQGQKQRLFRRCGWNNFNDVLDQRDWTLVAKKRLAPAWDGRRQVCWDATRFS
jgi:hypothetical protein